MLGKDTGGLCSITTLHHSIMLSSHMQEKHSVHHLKSLQFHRDVNILMLSSMGCLFIINYFKYMYLQK